MSDDQLVELYAKGNNRAFDVLLSKYQSKLYSYIYYIVRDEDVANDIFQDTFLKAIVRIQDGSYQSSGKFQAWLTRIAHNLVMDHFRDKEQENTISNDEVNYDLLGSAKLMENNKEDQLLVAQSLKDARSIMDMLPQAQNQVVRMRFYENLSFKEIAERLDISINTALGRMRYAVINMRAIARDRGIAFYAE